MIFENYYSSYNVVVLGPKSSLEKNNSKTRLSSGDKRFLPTCSRPIERDKPRRENLSGSKRFFDNYCGSNRINSLEPKMLLKTQTSEKSNLPSEKIYRPFFLVLSGMTNLREQLIRTHKAF